MGACLLRRVPDCAQAEQKAAEALMPAHEVLDAQTGGCGGFGKGNFTELFKSIEDYERVLDGSATLSAANVVIKKDE